VLPHFKASIAARRRRLVAVEDALCVCAVDLDVKSDLEAASLVDDVRWANFINDFMLVNEVPKVPSISL
jgi:hypothetical protein